MTEWAVFAFSCLILVLEEIRLYRAEKRIVNLTERLFCRSEGEYASLTKRHDLPQRPRKKMLERWRRKGRGDET